MLATITANNKKMTTLPTPPPMPPRRRKTCFQKPPPRVWAKVLKAKGVKPPAFSRSEWLSSRKVYNFPTPKPQTDKPTEDVIATEKEDDDDDEEPEDDGIRKERCTMVVGAKVVHIDTLGAKGPKNHRRARYQSFSHHDPATGLDYYNYVPIVPRDDAPTQGHKVRFNNSVLQVDYCLYEEEEKQKKKRIDKIRANSAHESAAKALELERCWETVDPWWQWHRYAKKHGEHPLVVDAPNLLKAYGLTEEERDDLRRDVTVLMPQYQQQQIEASVDVPKPDVIVTVAEDDDDIISKQEQLPKTTTSFSAADIVKCLFLIKCMVFAMSHEERAEVEMPVGILSMVVSLVCCLVQCGGKIGRHELLHMAHVGVQALAMFFELEHWHFAAEVTYMSFAVLMFLWRRQEAEEMTLPTTVQKPEEWTCKSMETSPHALRKHVPSPFLKWKGAGVLVSIQKSVLECSIAEPRQTTFGDEESGRRLDEDKVARQNSSIMWRRLDEGKGRDKKGVDDSMKVNISPNTSRN
ncbi:expressed unknown protein [Seminavis robusta]|uniref:Uncharacterized protein n=1 Tax=Seminavis robusta TaxID=568900 RepID=A0A9N8E3B8_9STRA|nr:expressed unknown protein [Seminavis robusta]|eukprot:Sro616_g175980.1 n/a (521) ;mRNA; f:31566-33751